jgi:hypothetical protein
MTPSAPECAQTTKSRWFPFNRRNVFVFTLLFVACGIGLALWSLGLPVSWTADYDGKRYTQICSAIDADPKHLLGKSFDEISRKLGLEDVPWDDAAVQQEPGMFRIYHFRGFALYVTLERLPAGITPDSRTPWTSTGKELERHGVLWLAHQYPCVKIDGISDGKERMKRYWKAIDEVCERINAEMRKRGRSTLSP